MSAQATVLILDDDPSHLRIYGWIVEAAGYHAATSVVKGSGIELPGERPDLVLLDYHLAGQITAVQAVTTVRSAMPGIPIVVLSDLLLLPEDIAPVVQGFVRKGDPGKLVLKLREMLKN